ncbi:tRNA (adenosine(37)-N6)-threonylcarbamoyltransferase complex dimerization subunit type 1 TsaB [Weizmannia acidilactici]|uniref:tRNA (Adenosine(37)-N6)-threonylcarbamoyltransferase complex dimerization subunit type 1 TsaB n=1 Tax=Weizmannia acidilactici TaxID=2607726 RepID=A0A5J4JID4_9BACI|nr:tRNA (adenosine(37)-N6)-threonylcarbamoyltransferase complex dimerization subunit type 1 TsaB [Weizmannia acidilactici]GER67770.1 tRNA (adenosine(37)-N6)-threonylcarbamoyltransferase complex dimerization subunit type 1 TsaB [Weizmannia acidilactici]GER71883.1 tRNA (adenosine(37)-N6)-threonylcarbamoyltransferase complex dimerization subunit type 1 TsaB [Weizmannia acidilactici]GER74025.1 tRNA (adenosine(37)-N6)-threonylcarbamoyltransferase complex dimerization subunit type 1 TsaB [Weizmannia a
MNILAIDTSNEVLGVSLVNGNTVLAEYITNLKKNHSVRVMPAIQQVMEECGVRPGELDKIVVAKGPGSYTGVRIGVTIAKTMAWSLQIPLVGVSSLKFIAAAGRYFDGYISPLFDARRGQIYTGLYRYENGNLETVIDDCNILSAEWGSRLCDLNQPVLFIGQNVALHEAVLAEKLQGNMVTADWTMHNPRPSELAKLGMDEPGEAVHTFVPNYIRLVEAEAKWLEKHKREKS